jgi:hypothetical protein
MIDWRMGAWEKSGIARAKITSKDEVAMISFLFNTIGLKPSIKLMSKQANVWNLLI